MKVVFWGSSDFSIPSLELIEQNHNLIAVVTNPDAFGGRGMKEIRMTPVKIFALEHNIPVLQPESLKDESFFRIISQLEIDINVIVSYGMIIPERYIYLPEFHSINLHASLLPKYRGASPMQSAILNGDSRTGLTVQFISKEMDKGDIILQKNSDIMLEENFLTLSERLSKEGALLLKEALELIQSGEAVRVKQNEDDASYTKLIKKENGKISFLVDRATDIYNKWRAFYPWPGIFTYYVNKSDYLDIVDYLAQPGNGVLVYLTDIKLSEGKKNNPPGTIIKADKQGFIIACKDQAIRILKIKPAGKKEMDSNSFINGYKPSIKRYF